MTEEILDEESLSQASAGRAHTCCIPHARASLSTAYALPAASTLQIKAQWFQQVPQDSQTPLVIEAEAPSEVEVSEDGPRRRPSVFTYINDTVNKVTKRPKEAGRTDNREATRNGQAANTVREAEVKTKARIISERLQQNSDRKNEDKLKLENAGKLELDRLELERSCRRRRWKGKRQSTS